MAVPDFQSLTLPVLKEFADGSEHPTKEIRERVARQLGLSAEDIAENLPSGGQTRFANRVAWAHVYMKQAGLLESVRRGVYRITPRGREVLASPPPQINLHFLERYPEYLEFRARQYPTTANVEATSVEPNEKPEASILTPDEQIRAGYQLLKANLAAQLLERVRQASPSFFEELVVEVLVKMGYGGSQEDAAQVVGKSGDGGIDGIIKEDRLGLESIYVQAKRWEATVGRPTIQQFAGALHGNRARKGVVITTSNFSREALDYVKSLQTTIVLIDGPQLAEYMIEFGVGVTDVAAIKLKRLDEDYFGEE
jgi:restriction system protein